jgi:hypothetical protein
MKREDYGALYSQIMPRILTKFTSSKVSELRDSQVHSGWTEASEGFATPPFDVSDSESGRPGVCAYNHIHVSQHYFQVTWSHKWKKQW